MARKTILIPYFLTAFLISWVMWGALILLTALGAVEVNSAGYYVFFLLGGFGPTIAPFIVLPIRLGKEGFVDFLKRWIFRFCAGWPAYAAGIVFLSLAFILLYFMHSGLAPGRSYPAAPAPWTALLTLFPMMIVGGGLEEVGWRGTALKELLERFSALPAVSILSVLWIVWHVPLFLIPGTSQSTMNFVYFALMGFGLSFLISSVFILGRSAVPCIIAHALFNAYLGLGRLYPVRNFWKEALIGGSVLVLGLAVFLVLFRGGLHKKFLERGIGPAYRTESR